MNKTIEEILSPKPEARLRIYAYSIDDEAHKGLLKVGQTTRDVKQRVVSLNNVFRAEGDISPRYGVYCWADWLRALLDITTERRQALLEATEIYAMFYNYPEKFYATPDISLRWAMAKSWSAWRSQKAEWKQMYSDIRTQGCSDVSVRMAMASA